MARLGVPQAEALLRRWRVSVDDLLGLRFAINVALATTIVWQMLRRLDDSNPIWAIASMIAASDPQPVEAWRMFKSRITNVAVGCAAGLAALLLGGSEEWILPLTLAATVLLSSYVVRVKTMWRQAPITAAVVIAAAVVNGSSHIGVVQGLHKVAEVVFGCVVGVVVSVVMSKVWLIQPSAR
jgi:uncharacterized membrane protein YccC